MPLKMIEETQPWYEKGLHFQCTQCGKCCTGSPGYVWLSDEEIKAIAQYLKISIEQVHQKYLLQKGERYSLKDLKHAGYSCIFLKDKQCSIYPVRPKQCQTYPFWPSILKQESNWEEEAKHCEGIRKEHGLVSKSEITQKLKA